MKVLGLSFGRKMQTCEMLVKEALMAAEAEGHEVQFVRMMDLEIKPCTGCGGCFMGMATGRSGRCIIKDDLPLVDELLMESDGLIVAAPVYAVGPAGLLKTVVDRFGPSHDIAFLTETNKRRIAEGKTGDQLIDPRNFKERFAGLISVGGAMTRNWTAFGLPTMHLMCFSSQIKVIDQIDAYDMGRAGSCLLDKKLMAKTAQMGRNIAAAMGKPAAEVSFKGEEEGICPVCHNNLLTVFQTTTVECPVCGIYGKVSIEGEKLTVTFSEAEQHRSRLNYAGKMEHYLEINSMGAIAAPKLAAAKEEIAAQTAKYKGYKEWKKNS